MSELPDDVHAGSRAWALRLLDECGLFRGRGAPLRAELESLVAGVELQGPRRPFFPSPWRVSDMFAGSCVALAALCALLERSHGRECHAAIDVEQATWIALAQYTIRWEIEGGGYWHENNAKVGG